MRIRDLFGEGRPVFSFEFFPPKTEKGEKLLLQTISRLRELEPSFVSVTYGAGGSTRQKTVEITTRVKREFGIEAMAHLTCVGHDRSELEQILDHLRDSGLENVLPLRGDRRGRDAFVPRQRLGYATEGRFIRRRGYPSSRRRRVSRGHVECPTAMPISSTCARKWRRESISSSPALLRRTTISLVERARRVGSPCRSFRESCRSPTSPRSSAHDDVRARIRPAPGKLIEVQSDDERCARSARASTRQCRECSKAARPASILYAEQSPATAAILAELKS